MATMRQLEALRAVIDHRTVTEAARHLRLSQPATSKLIAHLELALRLKLFRRERRRLIPTAEGMILYQHVQEIFSRLREIDRFSDELRTLAAGRLNVVTMLALGKTFLPETLAAFLGDRPEASASLHIHSARTAVEWVVGQHADLGFTMLPVDHPAVSSRSICRLKAVCALPPGHPLAGRKVIEARDLEGERFVSFTIDTTMRREVDFVFDSQGVRRQLRIEAYQSHPACHFVAAGLGVSVVDPFTAHDFARMGLITVRPFRPAVVYDFRMLWPRTRPVSLLAEAFMAHVEEALARHIRLTGAEPVGAARDRDTVAGKAAVDPGRGRSPRPGSRTARRAPP